MMVLVTRPPNPLQLFLVGQKVVITSTINCSLNQSRQPLTDSNAVERKLVKKAGKKEHHLWSKRDAAGSGQKALNLVNIVSGLPNEKEAVYGALDKWIAWEVEFPLIAAAKAMRILRKRNQWTRVIQVAKWMLSKGQGATMVTYDTLLLAFDLEQRVDEAESLWNMILHTHTRSISKRLFSRMISLYDHHDMPDKIIEVFADMEELLVRPDEDTVKRIARAFQRSGWSIIQLKAFGTRMEKHPSRQQSSVWLTTQTLRDQSILFTTSAIWIEESSKSDDGGAWLLFLIFEG